MEQTTIGILIFTNQGVLNHKLRDGKSENDCWCFWEMSRFPKQLRERDDDTEIRLYFAIKGQVKGYFIIHDLDEGGEQNLQFYSESWHPIEDGEKLKPSQGFRYYLHDSS